MLAPVSIHFTIFTYVWQFIAVLICTQPACPLGRLTITPRFPPSSPEGDAMEAAGWRWLSKCNGCSPRLGQNRKFQAAIINRHLNGITYTVIKYGSFLSP